MSLLSLFLFISGLEPFPSFPSPKIFHKLTSNFHFKPPLMRVSTLKKICLVLWLMSFNLCLSMSASCFQPTGQLAGGVSAGAAERGGEAEGRGFRTTQDFPRSGQPVCSVTLQPADGARAISTRQVWSLRLHYSLAVQ